jgi:hypothetical protein
MFNYGAVVSKIESFEVNGKSIVCVGPNWNKLAQVIKSLLKTWHLT